MLTVFSYYTGKTGLAKILVHLTNGSPFKKHFFNLPMVLQRDWIGALKRLLNSLSQSGLWQTSKPSLCTLLSAVEREDLWHPGYFIGRAVVKALCLITLTLTHLHNSNLQGKHLKDELDSLQSPSCCHVETSLKIR